MSDLVVLVSAGLLQPKKGDHAFARKHRYLNYGLLTLGTILHEHGHPVMIFHGGFTAPEGLAEDLVARNTIDGVRPLLLSLPSHLSIAWAQRFLSQLKRLCPVARIIVGGRWVVGGGAPWIRAKLPEVDLVVYGTAEDRILDLVDHRQWYRIPGTDLVPTPSSSESWAQHIDLRYEIVDDYLNFHPSIEVSRGCGMGCHFCEERHLKLTPIRGPENLVRGMLCAAEVYSDPHLHFYMEASRFAPSAAWAHEFAKAYHGAHLNSQWRCETRVDGVHQAALADLAHAGLKVLDLGLESGSATQLLAMNKTRHAQRYLERASNMLRQCRDLGIWTKVNVMLYAGETEQTLAETQSWLSCHKDCIKGVSVGPVAVYGHGASAHRFLKELRSKGASPVDPGSIERDGCAHLHLSKDVDYDRAKAISLRFAQEFMGARDYYDLKSFSYLPRGYSYDQFQSDMRGLLPENLPFRVN